MGKVVFDISVSLDGYVAGPDDSPELGLGVGGERLHEWVVELESWREPHGLEGGETNASSEIVESDSRCARSMSLATWCASSTMRRISSSISRAISSE